MNKNKIWTVVLLAIILILLGAFSIAKIIQYNNDKKVKNATIIVNLKDDLTTSFREEIKVSDFIENINGLIIDDYKIDTTSLGLKTINFKYINDENITIPYSFDIEIRDTTPPLVWLSNTYSITTSFKGSLEEKILCADDYDDEPSCIIEGTYNTKKVGSYLLHFIATDSSGNKTDIPFTLRVSKPSSTGGGTSSYALKDAKKDLGGQGVKFGIDVSEWQGNLNFQNIKDDGIEFAFIRVGSTKGADKEFFLDSKFIQNIKGFNEIGIPVGVYFYSYANSEEQAKKEAEWVIEQIKDYKVDLPIAFDFEDWSNYNKYKMSLYRLNRNAEVFIQTLEEAGYKGMLYGSVNYLKRIWDMTDKTVWAAHYTKNADYQGKYAFWQFSASGKVNGINGYVDLDIMYDGGIYE